MGLFFSWVGFFGAWLLFAGPVYQAALELREEEIRREDLERLQAGLTLPPPVSAWWWLLPPVKLVLERRRGNRVRQELLDRIDVPQLEGLITYLNKATGWLLVGLGGLFIACKESWELVEHAHWEPWSVVPLIVAMALICVAFVATRIRRSQQMLARKRQEAA